MVRYILLLAGILLITVTSGCGSSPKVERGKSPASVLPTPGLVVVEFHRQGGMAGLCDDVTVHADGIIEYHTCGQPTHTATLTQSEQIDLAGWVSKLRGFTFRQEDNPGGPDNLVREMKFIGQGSTPATDEQKQKMLDWLEVIYSELAQQPQPGSAASTAGRVLDIVNGQIIVIKPDEPGHDLIAITPQTQFNLTSGDTATLADVSPGAHIRVEGVALGAGGLQADTVVIESSEN
ncbi:MAG: hypothetical protein ACE5HA_15175 [Anaerolineae bacterium]